MASTMNGLCLSTFETTKMNYANSKLELSLSRVQFYTLVDFPKKTELQPLLD